MKLRALIVLLCLAGVSQICTSADIYRWVDEKGQTNISESVPERYKRNAQRIDSRRFEITDAERQQAIAVRNRTIAAASNPKQNPPATQASSAPLIGQSAPQLALPGKSRATDCASLLQRYRASEECFRPFRLENGGIHVEAFQHCETLEDPAPTCGPPTSK